MVALLGLAFLAALLAALPGSAGAQQGKREGPAGEPRAAGEAAGGQQQQELVVEVIGAGPDEMPFQYDADTGRAVAESRAGQVRVTMGKTVITGKRLEYQEKNSSAVMTGNVHLTHPEWTVDADRLDADLEREDFTFTGRVQAHFSGTDREGKPLQFDVAAARMVFQSRSGRVHAEGAVRIVEGDRVSTSQRAVYEPEADTLTLTGDAVIRTPGRQEARGDRYVLHVGRGLLEGFGRQQIEFILERKAKSGGPGS